MGHPAPRRNRLVLLVAIASAILRRRLRIGAPGSLETLDEIVRRSLPAVGSISPHELQDIVGRKGVLLLDCRSPEEHRVSHIAGAIRVDPDIVPAPAELPIGGTIICYCSIGVRSAAYAAALIASGLVPAERCLNLSGGIFGWYNWKLQLVDENGPSATVHPYSRLWRPFLIQTGLSATKAGPGARMERRS
jgi:rhodanese-related sulfurtransferase